jgi:starvation-inducible DNA-binding protein
MTDMNIGITADERNEVAKNLTTFLAETYALYAKTHNYHWNVTGPMFDTLHKLFEEHYNDMWMAVDEVAERIRALDSMVPGDLTESATIALPTSVPKAKEMIADLIKGHETVVRVGRKLVETAEDAHDAVTADMVTGRMQIHEKDAWMLRSLLES